MIKIKKRRGDAKGAFDLLLRTNQKDVREPCPQNTSPAFPIAEGYCLIMKKNKKLTKRFLCLDGTDLYCYKENDKKTKLFYHTLVGALLSPLELENIKVTLNQGSNHFLIENQDSVRSW